MSRKSLSLISLVLVFALLFGFSGCSLIETEEEETTVVSVKTPLPTDVTSSVDDDGNTITDTEYSPEALAANTATIFDYFNANINAVKSAKAAVSFNSRPGIGKAEDEEGNRLPYCENEYLAAAFGGIKDKFVQRGSDSAMYGESLDKLLPVKGTSDVSLLTLDEIESATCVDDGAVRTVTVNLKSPVEQTSARKAFDLVDAEAVVNEFAVAEKYITVGTPEVTYKTFTIILKINVETDEITQIRYEKSSDVTVLVTGNGELEDIGTVPLTFNYSVTDTYDFDYTEPETEA